MKRVSAENVQGDSAETELEVSPLATLNPTSGTVDDIVSVTGTGFGYGSEVIVYFKTSKVAYADTDQYGSFKATFKVPVMKADSYAVRVEDAEGNTGRIEFTIVADASLDKTEGSVGTGLTVSGTGFEAGRYTGVILGNAQSALVRRIPVAQSCPGKE